MPIYDRALSETAADTISARTTECYRNAILAIVVMSELRDAIYVEGYYVTALGIPFEHGWLETADGQKIVDPTAALLERKVFEDASAIRYFPAERYSRQETMERAVREHQTLPLYGIAGTANVRRAYRDAMQAVLGVDGETMAVLDQWLRQAEEA